MTSMFLGASSFNQDLNNWDVSKVTSMHAMFRAATSFNGNISDWDVSKVTTMTHMFYDTPFNQDISNWNVGSNSIFNAMFIGADSFNQDISGWDVSKGTTMNNMFEQAFSFNQDLSTWNISNVASMEKMFEGANALSDSNKRAIHGSFKTNSNWPYDWSPPDPDIAPTDLALSANSIAENTDTTNAVKVGDVTVTDDGKSAVVFSVAGTDASSFEIQGQALMVRAGVALDYETKASYSIDLVATDTVGSYTETVTVAVSDVNEVFQPQTWQELRTAVLPRRNLFLN